MWYNVEYKAYRNGRRLILPLEMGVLAMTLMEFCSLVSAVASVLSLVMDFYYNHKKK
jgi:hypothetical protein